MAKKFRTPNPFHEGIEEAKRSGQQSSRDYCLKRPNRANLGYEDVSTDWRTQEREKAERKRNNKRRAMYKRWGIEFDD